MTRQVTLTRKLSKKLAEFGIRVNYVKQKKVMRKAEKLCRKFDNDYYSTQFRTAKQEKCNLVTAAKCTDYRSMDADCKNDSSKLYALLNGLLGKSNGENPLPIRSCYFQLANEFNEYFLLEVKRISDMFGNIPPSRSQLIPDFPVLSLTKFAEMNKEEIICIVNTV